MKKYNAEKEWSNEILNKKDFSYPAEYVIRIFKGNYPHLKFSEQTMKKKKICDLGCGDGRNLILLNDRGFKIYGVEISEKIINKVKLRMNNQKIECDIKVGTNSNIPYKKSFFDFLLSWNSCYYMDNELGFEKIVKEFARTLKKNGYLILSIPKKTCFIYKKSNEVKKGYRMIKNDPFKIRNGQILRYFENENEIKKSFSKYFKNFIFASIEDDCFGLNYHWHLVICQKKISAS
jgi:SAM-dependent methyltransferase